MDDYQFDNIADNSYSGIVDVTSAVKKQYRNKIQQNRRKQNSRV